MSLSINLLLLIYLRIIIMTLSGEDSMEEIIKEYIRDHVVNSKVIYKRGENIFHPPL